MPIFVNLDHSEPLQSIGGASIRGGTYNRDITVIQQNPWTFNAFSIQNVHPAGSCRAIELPKQDSFLVPANQLLIINWRHSRIL